MLNERPKIKNPKELGITIDTILDLYEYDRNNFSKRVFLGIFGHEGTADELLHKCKTEARKNAVLLIDQEPLFPPLPSTQPDPLDDLREIQHWCIMASRAKPEKPAATQTPANGIQGKDEPPQNPSIKKEKYWTFTYKDKTVTVDGALDGCFYIEVLLTHPNKEYTATELRFAKIKHDTGKDIDIRQSPQKYIENPDIIKGRIDSLEKEKNVETDPARIVEIDDEIEQLNSYLSSAHDIKGKPRNFNANNAKSVRDALNVLKKQIKPQHRDLYNHLTCYLKTGGICKYVPDSKTIWEIS